MYGVEYDASKDKDNAEIVFANTANAIFNPTLKETDRDKFWQIIDRAAMFRGGDKGLLTTFGVVTSFDKVMGNNITNKSADDGTWARGAKTAWNTFWSSNIIGNAWKMAGNDYVGQETESTVLPK
jgi:hypothetical protein